MAFKSPCLVSSTCNCGGDTCKSLRRGIEAGKSLRKFDLGSAPLSVEVDAAVTELQSFLQEMFSHGSKWLQPLMSSYDSSILDSRGYQLICKGFHWLLTDPSFKVMVISLCMDKGVWESIKTNGVMEKLQELPSSGRSGGNENFGSSRKGNDFVSYIISWILRMSLTKIGELIENFVLLLSNASIFSGKEKLKPEKREELDEKIQSSFVLSLVILLIVVVARAQIG